METIKNYKCPCCGAALVFNAATQKLHCESCGNDFDTETLQQTTDAEAAASADNKYEWDKYTPREFKLDNNSMVEYECPSCGAQITGDASLGATICPYCGNTTIMKQQFEGVYMPDYIIPFKIEKKEAKEKFHEMAKRKILIPKKFKNNSVLNDITGLYVPFWMFDCNTDGDASYSAQRISMWTDSRYQYTKTDFYKLYRSGSAEFKNIPVDASKKADDAYMDAIEPFDYTDAVDFNSAYLSGYLADKYDVSIDDSIERANQRVRNSMDYFLKNNTGMYQNIMTSNLSVRFSDGKVRYSLLPVWMLNISYKDKVYKFAMNGQTGRVVGNYPFSWLKLVLMFLGSAVAAFGLGMGLLALVYG